MLSLLRFFKKISIFLPLGSTAYGQYFTLQACKPYSQQLSSPFFPEAKQMLLNKKQFWSY